MKLFLLLVYIPFYLSFSQINYNAEKFEYISPVPGSSFLLPQTNIIIRYGEVLTNFDLNDTSIIHVNGNLSGIHEGSLYITKDFKTIVFTPYAPFANGDTVTVSLSNGLKTATHNVDSLKFYFYVAGSTPSSNYFLKALSNKTVPKTENKNSLDFHSSKSSDLIFPPDFPKIFIKNRGKNFCYFIGINQSANNYLAIINESGVPVYYKRSSARLYDFKLQPSGLLTYYDDDEDKFYGLDSLYQVVDSFYSKNGYSTNFHELQILPDGHSFLLSYDPQKIDMSVIKPGAYTDATVFGSIIQEINEDKIVIWQWRSWDHYKITDADSSFVDFYQHTIEYSHINSIDVVDKDRIIFSVKNFNEVTAVDRNTGRIIWRLGGYNNQFSISGADNLFEQQHDARVIDGNKLTVFDNRKFETNENSRVLVYNLDEEKKTAKLITVISHTPEVKSKNMGNVQYASDSNYVIGWGNTGRKIFFMSEADAGNLISSDSLVSQSFIYSYRAFKFPWKTKLVTANKDLILFTNSTDKLNLIDSVAVKNNSLTPLDIDGVFIRNFSFNSIDSYPITILPGEEKYLHFTFQSSGSSEVKDTAYIAAVKINEMASLPIVLIGNSLTDIHQNIIKNPDKFSLAQNYPNPFNPSTDISYTLPLDSRIKIEIFSLLGQKIVTLLETILNKGSHKTKWNADGFPSGIYFYKMTAVSLDGLNNYSTVKKMLLLK